jgi:hypothetical protein
VNPPLPLPVRVEARSFALTRAGLATPPNLANGSPTFAHVPSFPTRLARPPNAKRPREREALLARQAVSGYFLASPNLPRSVFTKRASFPLAFISRKMAE